MKNRIDGMFATVLGIGYIPIAPGTWGSLPGVVLAWILHPLFLGESAVLSDYVLLVCCLFVCFAFTCWVVDRHEKNLGIHDDKSIVLDEVLGQLIALIFFPPTHTNLLLGFVLFRFFDILKIGPIAWVDQKVPGGLGTVSDDVLAGIFAALIMALMTTLGWF